MLLVSCCLIARVDCCLLVLLHGWILVILLCLCLMMFLFGLVIFVGFAGFIIGVWFNFVATCLFGVIVEMLLCWLLWFLFWLVCLIVCWVLRLFAGLLFAWVLLDYMFVFRLDCHDACRLFVLIAVLLIFDGWFGIAYW